MKGRILSLLLALCMMLSVLPLRAHTEMIGDSCGENVTWSLDKSSWVLPISGTGPVEDEVITPAIGHNYQDGDCLNCYQRDPDYLFSIEYANMTLGNSLAMNFAFRMDEFDDWGDAYVQIEKTYADGRDTRTVTIPHSQWGLTSIDGKLHYTVTFNDIAGKEMGDVVYVTVYDGEGKPLSNVWEDSVRSYAMRTLNNPNTAPESLTMIVDLLNYGAAAQLSFGYDTGNLANSKLTAQQAALATPSAWAEDSRVQGENYLGSQLRLESQILLRMAFSNVTADMTAQVSFTDHYGRAQAYTIEGSKFEITGSTAVVMIDQIVVADARGDVTVKITDSEGNVVASATDSVASYIARMRQEQEDPLYEAILKFADSAYLYFNPGAQLPILPVHSEYYMEGLSQDQVVEYFNEVCFGDGYIADIPCVHKWEKPIDLLVLGTTYEASMAAMTGFLDDLNTIEGFPGIVICDTPNAADWVLLFCQPDEMDRFVAGLPDGGNFSGAMNMDFSNSGKIVTVVTAVRNDLDQQTSTSMVLKVIYNGLGPLMDTMEREDSIIYRDGLREP